MYKLFSHIAHWFSFFPVLLLFQSAQNLAQISDLQAQLEEALKEKQDVHEKVSTGLWLSAGHQCHSFRWKALKGIHQRELLSWKPAQSQSSNEY